MRNYSLRETKMSTNVNAKQVSFLYQQIDDWHYLQLWRACFSDHWSLISSRLKPTAIMVGSIAGKEQSKAMTRIGLEHLHRQTTRWGGTFSQVSSDQLVRLDREYEFCFLDSNTELTEELAEIAAVNDHYSLDGLVDLKPLIPFAEACGAGLVYFYRDGIYVSVLSRSFNVIIDIFRTQLKLNLVDCAHPVLDTVSVDQLSRLLKLRDNFLTIGKKEVEIIDQGLRMVVWDEGGQRPCEACDITLREDDISISEWESRPLPKYLVQKNHPFALLALITAVIAIPIAALYGLFKLIGYIISLFR